MTPCPFSCRPSDERSERLKITEPAGPFLLTLWSTPESRASRCCIRRPCTPPPPTPHTHPPTTYASAQVHGIRWRLYKREIAFSNGVYSPWVLNMLPKTLGDWKDVRWICSAASLGAGQLSPGEQRGWLIAWLHLVDELKRLWWTPITGMRLGPGVLWGLMLFRVSAKITIMISLKCKAKVAAGGLSEVECERVMCESWRSYSALSSFCSQRRASFYSPFLFFLSISLCLCSIFYLSFSLCLFLLSLTPLFLSLFLISLYLYLPPSISLSLSIFINISFAFITPASFPPLLCGNGCVGLCCR